MALIKCPECGKEVSDRAPTCIYCGFPLSEGIGTPATTQTSTPVVDSDSESSKGEVKEFVIENGVLTKYQGSQKYVFIPKGVTSIGDLAFADCLSLSLVSIPSGVKSIGKSAFSGCTGLTSITIPSSVTVIEERAFFKCSALILVQFEDDSHLESIGNKAFRNCKNLSQIEIPDGVKQIGDEVFGGCKLLTDVKIPESVTQRGENLFGRRKSTAPIEAQQEIEVQQEIGASNKVASPKPGTEIVGYYQDKTPKSSSKSDSQIGENFSIRGLLVGLIPIFMLLVGLPLGNYKKGSAVGTVGRWEVDTSNMYERTSLLIVALVTILCVVVSGLIIYLRRKSRFNFVDNIAVGISWLSVASMIFGAFSFYNNMESSAAGGVGAISGSRFTPTFWYYVIVLVLIFYATVINAYCQNRKDTETK